jgi:hypothetical protein
MKILAKHNSLQHFTILFSSLLVIVLFSSGCNVMKTSCSYDQSIDFKSYKTFTINRSINNLRMNPDGRAVLDYAISDEMKARGYQKTEDLNPDLWIDLFINYKSSTDITQSVGMPIGWYSYAYSFGLSATVINYHDSKDGTLFMSIVDGKKKEIIWTGQVSTGIQEGQTDQQKEKLINKVVKKIFKEYPVPVDTKK